MNHLITDSEEHGSIAEPSIAIAAITRNGVDMGLQLQAKLPGSVCYVPERHRFALAMGAVGFKRIGALFPVIWPKHRAFVCIMATGIVVRQIAPLLRHKALDPAVVVIDEKGRFVISLVSGHLGGANRLARQIARLIGGQAVITTASDVQDKPALDLIALEAGLEIGNTEMLSRAARAVLEDEPLWVCDPQERLEPYLQRQLNVIRLPRECASSTENAARFIKEERDAVESLSAKASVGIWVSEFLPPPGLKCLALHPRNLVVGVGCNRGTTADEILGLLQTVFARKNISPLSIRNLVSIDLKSDEPGILEAAKRLDRPVDFYCRSEIENIAVPNPSGVVQTYIGVQSVCEATALLSARSEKLIVSKQKTANATLAVARVGLQS